MSLCFDQFCIKKNKRDERKDYVIFTGFQFALFNGASTSHFFFGFSPKGSDCNAAFMPRLNPGIIGGGAGPAPGIGGGAGPDCIPGMGGGGGPANPGIRGGGGGRGPLKPGSGGGGGGGGIPASDPLLFASSSGGGGGGFISDFIFCVLKYRLNHDS